MAPAADKQKIVALAQAGRLEEAGRLCSRFCKRNKQDAEAWFLLGAIQGQLGNFPEAEKCCRKAIALQPNVPMAHCNLGTALLNQRKLDQAADAFKTAIRLNPQYAEAYHNLANTLQFQEKYGEAVTCYEQAIRLSPNNAELHFNMANALKNMGNWADAATHYHQAIRQKPDFEAAYGELATLLINNFRYDAVIDLLSEAVQRLPHAHDLHFKLGVAYQEQGNTENALISYRKTLDIAPNHAGARAGIASIQGLQGNLEEAEIMLDSLLEDAPDDPSVTITFANFAPSLDRVEEAIELTTRQLENPALSDSTRAKLHFALGKLHDRQGAYDTAFTHYRQGNELRHAEFDPVAHERHIELLTSVFDKDSLGRMPRATATSDRPIFIVGMPRSGTSLVEQILASHPEVFGAGELPNIATIVAGLPKTLGVATPYPECMEQITQQLVDDISHEHLDYLSRLAEGRAHVTDKTPTNFMHLGLIDILFPGARIIYCLRDPLDTCLSCYFQSFGGEHPYAYDLTHLGEYYRQHLRLMDHWKNALRIPILEVRYEDLVSDQEAVTRKMLEFCNLEWDDRCLHFHRTRRTIATASFDQARQPIYTKSVARWKNYEKYLEPLKSALAD